MAGAHITNLLDLPVDVLALILTPLVKFESAIELCPCPDHGELGDQLEVARSLLLVHPHLHAIACPMLYNLNTFKLSIVPGKHGALQAKMLQMYSHSDAPGRGVCTHPGLFEDYSIDVPGSLAAEERRGMGKLQLFVTSSARRRIRNFVLEVGRHRGWIDQFVTPVLADMILAGHLASLSITLLYRLPDLNPRGGNIAVRNSRASTSFSSRDAVMFTKPPLRGFLQVLADPDLESSRLFLTRGHPPAWCKYHDKGLYLDTRGTECPAVARVDWQAIVREVLDPEGVNTAAHRSEAEPRARRA
ncbi:hypothetical protein BBO_03963 [Beauveria brongniartii RCEF 3172]|uniref:F-box domain-containing protein n=1 Tax=Beauveria brongniartii RCEF 3172 TaxID=1081107 RepID=A0A162LTP9_9HYPO|nr:hypothetical protein BBO_03963 [Beauveria brongniartii RCEF 3172]